MQKKPIKIWRGSKIRIAILAAVLAILIGCATNGAVKPAAVVPEAPVAEGPLVTRLEDGREGFIITEVAHMDEKSRLDFKRAVVMLNNQDYDQAIDLLEQVIEQSPGVSAPYINMAIACRRVGRPEQAEKHLKTALRLIPGHPMACNEYGLLYRHSGRFAEARAIYEEALSHFPDFYPIHKNLGILCDLYLNDQACALEHYEIYSQALPDDQQVKLWIAELRIRLGQE